MTLQEPLPPTKPGRWKSAAIALAVLTGLTLVSLFVLVGIGLRNAKKIKQSFMFAATNNQACGLPGVLCSVDPQELPLPPLPTSNNYSAAIARFAADLVNRLSLARTERRVLLAPLSLSPLAVLNAEAGDKLGWVLKDTEGTQLWIVFRGTASKQEWEKDFELQQVPFVLSLAHKQASEVPIPKLALQPTTEHVMFAPGIKVHYGFLDTYLKLRPQLMAVLKEHPNVPIYVTGHSLGAAIATLCTLDLATNTQTTKLNTYTFGTPRVGNPQFSRAFDEVKTIQSFYQIANVADVVFSVPLSVMPNTDDPKNPYLFQHAGDIMGFSDNWGSWTQNHTMPIYIQNLDNVSLLSCS